MTTELNLTEAAMCMEQLILANVPVYVEGAPGVGKSEVIDQVAGKINYKVIEYRASIREPVDLRGVPVPDLKAGVTRWLAPDELPREDRDGKFGILKLDEINTASLSMQAACFGLVLERRIGDYHLPAGWVPVAAGNRLKDKAAAQRMPTALANRFAILAVKADTTTWASWATKNDVHPYVIAFLRFRPNLIHIMPTSDDQKAFPTPRSWVALSKVLKRLDVGSAVVRPISEALVGTAATMEFSAFLSIVKDMPTIDDIVDDPIKARVPAESNVAQLYALATGLARMATRANIESIAAYVKRMPREFEVLSMTDAIRNENLSTTKALTQWAVANSRSLTI